MEALRDHDSIEIEFNVLKENIVDIVDFVEALRVNSTMKSLRVIEEDHYELKVSVLKENFVDFVNALKALKVIEEDYQEDDFHEEPRRQLHHSLLFVDDMRHVPICDALKLEFMEKYTKDFEVV